MRYTTPYAEHPLVGSLGAIDLARFNEGLCVLFDEMSEDGGDAAAAFASLVLEVAASAQDSPEDARKWASYFTSKGPAFTKSKEGLAALRFETWLMLKGGALFERFVETVLDKPGAFLAIFSDKIQRADLERMETAVGDFMTLNRLVDAGDRDYEAGVVSELTIFDCKPSSSRRQRPNDSATPRLEPSPKIGGSDLLPSGVAAYSRVNESGGLSSEAIRVVFNQAHPFRKVQIDQGHLTISDPNGVVWVKEDDRWFVDLDSARNVMDGGPANKIHNPSTTKTGLEPTSSTRNTSPLNTKARRKGGDRHPAPAQYESLLVETDDTGSVRSTFGSWAIVEGVTNDGPSTILVVQDRAWSVSVAPEAIHGVLARVGALYEGLPLEGDLTVEAFLTEMGEETGVEVSNPERLVEVLSSTALTVSQRDDVLARRYEAEPPLPPPEGDEEEEQTTDRKEKPPFYRDDLQVYYDTQITVGLEPEQALSAVRKKFKLKKSDELEVTPAGEVRAKGVVDNPDLVAKKAPAAPPPEASEPPPAPPEEEPEPKPGDEPQESLTRAERSSLAKWWAAGPNRGTYPALLRRWARSGGLPESEVRQGWQEATQGHTGGLGRVLEATTRFKRFLALQEGSQAVPVVPFRDLDLAFAFWLVYEDGDLSEWPDWVRQHAPHLKDRLAVWNPNGTTLQEGDLAFYRGLYAGGSGSSRRTPVRRLPKERPSTLDDSQRAKYERWVRLVNTRPKYILEFVRSPLFRKTLDECPRSKRADLTLAKEAARHALRMKLRPVEEWDATDWNWCGRVTKFIERLRRTSTPLVEQGTLTRKYVMLRAWGHDPGLRSGLSESEFREAASDARQLHRLIDSLPGAPPHLTPVQEEGPRFPTLKKNRVALSADEHAEVLRRKAVWHFNQGKPSPAVWKSRVGEAVWYVTNTHRAYNVAKTLDGAIQKYHSFIKTTA